MTDNAAAALPKLVAFDLDATLWLPELYEMAGSPYRCDQGGRVIDRANEEIALFPEAHAVLHELHSHPRWQGVQVAYASRTTCGDFADECLQLIRVRSPDGVHGPSLREVAHHFQIFPGEKIAHFRAIAKASGLAYEDMIFFDNEHRNCVAVASLGVHTVYTPDGLSLSEWQRGLAEYAAKARKRRKNSSTSGK